MILTFSQLVKLMIDGLKLSQPSLDTKDGSVARDLFVDLPADQLAQIYTNINNVSKAQSFLSAAGKILDQFGSNFNITRSTGNRAVGQAILTFTGLSTNISIPSGSTLTAKNGIVFQITTNITILAANKGIYASLATQLSSQLNLAGISDQYAIQVPVEALSVGKNGNIAVYSLIRHSIPGISNVTNVAPLTNGSDPQADSDYKNSIIAKLSGSNVGTAIGYTNALLNVAGLSDVLIVEPGNPLLSRDGTVSQRNADGTLTIITPGAGGKVDIWVKGSDEISITENYVYHDESGRNDPTSSANDHILGQTIDTSALTITERRNQSLQTGIYPQQPVDALVSLTGSQSGANFILGVNYELIKDTNNQTESTPFALDRLHFLTNTATSSGESISKGAVNSVDKTSFVGVQDVSSVSQVITISNDLAALSKLNNTQITAPHSPITTMLRATNLTTGERYVITDQNLDVSGLNETGSVSIDGQILPTMMDKIQVDYNWYFNFDKNTDYFDPSNSSFTKDAIDWGKGNYINFDAATLIRNGGRYQLSVSDNVDRVITAFVCQKQTASIIITSQVINNIQVPVAQVNLTGITSLLNVASVVSITTGLELYNTKLSGSFSGTTINMASDVSQPANGEQVIVYFNSYELYNIANNNGSILDEVITLSSDDVLSQNNLLIMLNDLFNGISTGFLFVNYITEDVNIVERTTLSSMPFSAVSGTNTFVNNTATTIAGRQPADFNNANAITRFSPTYLSLTIDNSFGNAGAFSVSGLGWFQISTTLLATQTNVSGLFDLNSIIIATFANLSSFYSIARLGSLTIDGVPLSINGYSIASNIYDNLIAQKDASLSNSQINLATILAQNGLTTISLGASIELVFYVIDPSTGETITFTNGRGTLYSKYKYVLVNNINLISGFINPSTSLVSGNITIGHISQPVVGSTYSVNYDYTAPVENETLTIQYQYNNIIQDAIVAAEVVRPLTADVLVRLANAINVNVSMNIVIDNAQINNSSSILDNVSNSVSNLINFAAMGSTLDYSDLIRVSSAVAGVDGVYITIFDYVGSDLSGAGNRQYIIADANQYFAPAAVLTSSGNRPTT